MTFCGSFKEEHPKQFGTYGASPIAFGPRTLMRTWGTRPIPSDPAMTRALLEVEDRLKKDAAVAGGRGAEEAAARQ
jgi:hypothetical protein